MKIEIWSDILCPFCFIGKRHLDKAIETLPFKDDLEIIWKSYQLDPNLTSEALESSKEDYLASRGYGKEQVEAMFKQLDEAGKPVGIHFRQDISVLVNSKRAHALIHYAALHDKSHQVKESLLSAHLSEAKNIAAEDVLKAIATEHGLNAEEAWTYIIEGKADEAIVQDIALAQEIGVKGVPFFVFDRKYAVSGAQPVEAFQEVITKAYEEQKPQIQIIDHHDDDDAASCGTDGCSV